MKNRILTFIIGMLTGAIITTSIFITINPFDGRENTPEGMGNPPAGEMVQPPEKPDRNIMIPSQ